METLKFNKTTFTKFNKLTDLVRIAKLAWSLVRSATVESISEGFKMAWGMVMVVINGARWTTPVQIVKEIKPAKTNNARIALKNAEIAKETAGAVLVKFSVFGNFSFYGEKSISLWFPKSQINLSDMTISKWMSNNKKSEIDTYFNDGKVYGFSC